MQLQAGNENFGRHAMPCHARRGQCHEFLNMEFLMCESLLQHEAQWLGNFNGAK